MKRRAVLAAGAAVALAGCSGNGGESDDAGDEANDDDPEEPTPDDESEGDDTDDGDEPDDADETEEEDEPEEYALEVLVIDENGEPIEDATVAVADDGGEPIEAFDGEDRGTTDEHGVAEATLREGSYRAGAIADDRQTVRAVDVEGDARVILRIEPTDEERAAEAVSGAQSELSAAVTELDEQSGELLDAADELSTQPIGDRLAATRVAVADAREFETTDEQEVTLSAIEDAEAFVRTLIDAQPWLHGVYRSIDRLHVALREGEDDRAIYAADDIDRDLEDGADRIEAVEDGAEAVEGRLEDVEAIDWLWTDDRRTALRADYRAAGEIVDAVEELLATEEGFWEGHEEFEEGAYVSARSSFGAARRAFEDVRTAFDPPESSAVDGTVGAIDCTVAAMATAADGYYWAADAARSGDDEREAEYVDRVEETLAEAEGCGLRPIEP